MTIFPLQTRKFYILLGHIFFAVFIGLAAFTFREREFVADNAFHNFVMLQQQSFAIFQERYSIILIQFLPVLGIKLKASLNTVLLLHSISVPVFSYICFCLAAHILKNIRAALGIVLGACIMVTQSFYFLFELHQAISLLILLHGFILIRDSYKFYHWCILFAGLALAFFLHPLVLIGFIYLAGYVLFQSNDLRFWRGSQRMLLIIGLGLAIVAVRSVFFPNPYEEEKTPGLEIIKLMFNVLQFPVTPFFFKWLLRDYYILLIFTGLISASYIWAKQFIRLAWYWVCLAGYVLLLLATYKQADESIRFYLELHFQILALIAVIPFVYDVWPKWGKKPIALTVLVLLLISRFITFYASKTIFTERLKWYEKMYSYTSQFPENRFVVDAHHLPGLKLQNQLVWASAYESFLYFASIGKQPLKYFLLTDNPEVCSLPKGKRPKTPIEFYPINGLFKHYFSFKPSLYRFLNTPITLNQNERIIIRPLVRCVKGRAGGGILTIPVSLQANSLVASGTYTQTGKMNSLSYYLYKHNQPVVAFPIITPLEVDIKGEYRQSLLLEIPAEAGEYEIELVFLPLGLASWNEMSKVKLIVK